MSEGNGRSESPNPNLRPPWQPGESGNPGGMPKGASVAAKQLQAAVLRQLRDHPEDVDDIAKALIQEAKTRPQTIVEGSGSDRVSRSIGSAWAPAQRLIWERVDGLLKQEHEHTGEGAVMRVLVNRTLNGEPS